MAASQNFGATELTYCADADADTAQQNSKQLSCSTSKKKKIIGNLRTSEDSSKHHATADRM
jgi:hypothetical protein